MIDVTLEYLNSHDQHTGDTFQHAYYSFFPDVSGQYLINFFALRIFLVTCMKQARDADLYEEEDENKGTMSVFRVLILRDCFS